MHRKGLILRPEWSVLVLVVSLTIFVGCGGDSTKPPASLVSLQIQSPASTVLLGRSEQLTALGKFDDGSSQDLTTSVTWTSANPVVALVGDNNGRKGFLTGVGGGSTTISAVSGAIAAKSGFAVTVPTPRFAYLRTFAIPSRAQTVSAYTVDPSTGSLSPLSGPPVPVAGTFRVSPDGNFLLALCSPTFSGADAICSFAIDRNTGALQRVSTTPPLSQTAADIVVSPTGRFLYATLAGCAISVFSIDARTGALTQLQNPPVVASQCGETAIDPAERFLYSAAPGSSGVILGFNIDQQTGMLTSMSGSPFQAPIDIGTSFNDLTMDVAGRSVYYDFNFNISDMALDGVTGSLTPLSRAGTATKFPCQITMSGSFVYVPDCFFGGISQFSIDPGTGKISAENTFSTGAIVGVLSAEPSGRFLYVVNLLLQLEIYSINSTTGALTHLSTMTLGATPGADLITQLLVIG
jgi:6-phosphogluconolactonase